MRASSGASLLAASVGKILGSSLFARKRSAGPLVTRGQAETLEGFLVTQPSWQTAFYRAVFSARSVFLAYLGRQHF